LRGYLAAGWQFSTNDAATVSLPGSCVGTTGGGASPSNCNNTNTYLLRAFIQLGGFTFGKTASFYDFFNTSKYTLQTNFIYQDFAGFGIFTYGYTQQLGNGFAATIAVQDPTPGVRPIVDVGGGTAAGSLFALAPTNNNNQNAGSLDPDIVGSLRVDQAWGGAQVAAIAHQVRARYWQDAVTAATAGEGAVNETGIPSLVGVGHPGDKWGWAVMAGLELNLPWFGKGDSFAIQTQYCVGASYDCYNNNGTRLSDNAWNLVNTNKIGLGWLDDGFMINSAEIGGTRGIELATNWNVWAAFQHYWVPELRTSLYGGYAQYKANSSIVDQEV